MSSPLPRQYVIIFFLLFATCRLVKSNNVCEIGFGSDPIPIRTSGTCLLPITTETECQQAAIDNMNKGGIYSNHGFDTSRDWTTVANVGCIFPSWTTKYYFNTGATSLQPCSESYRCICKTATCTRCPEGYYSNGGQNAICRPCEPGFFCKNETSRSACAAGKYNSLTLQVSEKSCIGCDKGTYQLLPGQGDKKSCISCPKGYYCPEPIYKMKCSIGTYNDLMEQTSETSCRNCSIGTYNSLLGQEECQNCAKGRFNDEPGQINAASCKKCNRGYYCDGSDGRRLPCSHGTYNDLMEQISKSSCKLCEAGKYGSMGVGDEQCSFCDAGTFNTQEGLITSNNCTECDANQYTEPTRQKCVRCSLLRPVTKDKTQCSDDYTVVIISGIVYTIFATACIVSIIRDPVYQLDNKTATEFEQRKFKVKIIMISSTAMFDFASDLFYIGSTPFESETLYNFAIFFFCLPTVLFCISNYNGSYIKNHFRVIVKTIRVKMYNVIIINKKWDDNEDLFMMLLGLITRIIFIPLLIVAYILSFIFYIVFIILFVSMKGSLHRASLRLFFQMGGILKESDWCATVDKTEEEMTEEEIKKEEEKNINYVFSSSIFAEIFFESFPELLITLLNEFVFNSTRPSVGLLFILSLSTSLWSIASAGYPLVHHIFQKGSLKDGLEEPYKKDKNLVINKLFELRRNTSILPVTSAERKDEIIKRQKEEIYMLKLKIQKLKLKKKELKQVKKENKSLQQKIKHLHAMYDGTGKEEHTDNDDDYTYEKNVHDDNDDEWERNYTEENEVYWFNSRTGESVWEKP